MSQIRAEPLTVQTFRSFGVVFDVQASAGASVNEGRGVRVDLALLDRPARAGLMPATAIYRLAPSPLPVRVGVLERHPDSGQAFLPLYDGRGLIVVAPSDAAGRPRPELALALIAPPRLAFRYSAGIWHAPLFALDEGAEYLMAMRSYGPDDARDCETKQLAEAIVVVG